MYKVSLKARKVLLSMFLISVMIGGMFKAPQPVEAATIKIMPVGDSCTEGMGDPSMGGYRTELYNLYKNAGLDFDFVGSNQRGPNNIDRDNEGHSGWTIPQIASNIDGWLNAQNPDVVLLWIGGNDVIQQGRVNTTGLSNLIDQILAKKPNIKIFVADYFPHPESIKAYNATIPGVVQEKANAGKSVYFVKLSGMQFSQGADISSDGLHLNPGGYSKVAKIWFDSTISILKGESSNPQPTNNPWNPQPTNNPWNPQPTPNNPGNNQTTGTIKIMPVGDSCTEGMGDPSMGGYRTDLYNLYKNAGLDFDFVGSNQRGPNNIDRDNEGHSGWTIPQIASNIDGWLNAQNPDVVLLWIGGNDLLQQGKINTTGLSNLIDQILAKKPNIKIFVADYFPHPESVKQYNATIPGVVQQKASAGKSVYFVKLSDIQFSQSADISSDGLHLNPGGYSKVAKIWFDSTISILKQSTSTPVPTPTQPTNVIKGDVDGNGSVNSIDFGYLRKYLLGYETDFPSSNGKLAADINNDGSVNSLDFANLRLILLGQA